MKIKKTPTELNEGVRLEIGQFGFYSHFDFLFPYFDFTQHRF